jgi:hypothetical protein
LIERDETPDCKAQPSIDNVLSTPATNASIQSRFAQLSNIKTPTSEPRPSHAQMHPHTVHQTTTKAPDSGLKLGFADPATTDGQSSLAVMQNTPSKNPSSQSDAKSDTRSPYEFKFRSASHLSNEAQQLMDNLRDEAARIKEQMKAEKVAQEYKDAEAEEQFQGFGAAGRKIAKPKGKAGRFSDVHMAAFKKMDSIANHASAFRANNTPSFAQPTAQSLKRSPSRAGLDELARPQTAGKGTPTRRPPPSRLPNRRTMSVSPVKSLPKLPQEESTAGPAKRQRQTEFGDVSTAKPQRPDQEDRQKPSTLPRPVSSSGVPYSLLSPTKSSLARTSSTKVPVAIADKPSMLPRSQSTKSLQPPRPSSGTPFKPAQIQDSRITDSSPSKSILGSTSKIPRSENVMLNRPLPPLPTTQIQSSSKSIGFSLKRPDSTKTLTSPTKTQSIASKLPTFASLKSILRPSRPQGLQTQAIPEQVGTPKRATTASATDSGKKVDFTPSVKSRYAVKLAAESPSPAKIHQDTPRLTTAHFDSAAYTMSDDTVEDEDWEDAEEDAEVENAVAYPTLPPASPAQKKSPSVQTVQAFMQKAKDVNRRESLDFKSLVANGVRTVHDNPFSMTAFNTTVNKTNLANTPENVMKSPRSASKPSPSTIRRVRPSDALEIVKPLEEPGMSLPHGLPAKKRRHDSEKHNSSDDAKENQHPSQSATKVPGGWEDSVLEENEGDKRGGKRVRIGKSEEPAMPSPQKKTPAREAAAKAAKDRKKSGILSMSRLNMLARPKGH